MLINELNQLLVYVPEGSGKQFISTCATSKNYASKIAFVEDTNQIFTGGKAFGVSSKEFAKLVDLVKANQDKLGELAEVCINTEAISALTDRVEAIELDYTTAAKLQEGLEELKSLILGTDLNEALDTIAEIDTWIASHEELFNELKEDVESTKNSLDELSKRVDALEEVSLWGVFEMDEDAIEVTEETMICATAADIASIEEPTETDVVVSTTEAVEYFAQPENSTVVFKNIMF